MKDQTDVEICQKDKASKDVNISTELVGTYIILDIGQEILP